VAARSRERFLGGSLAGGQHQSATVPEGSKWHIEAMTIANESDFADASYKLTLTPSGGAEFTIATTHQSTNTWTPFPLNVLLYEGDTLTMRNVTGPGGANLLFTVSGVAFQPV